MVSGKYPGAGLPLTGAGVLRRGIPRQRPAGGAKCHSRDVAIAADADGLERDDGNPPAMAVHSGQTAL